jgi:hypothetical protein
MSTPATSSTTSVTSSTSVIPNTTSTNVLTLSTLTADVEDFVDQFQSYLQNQPTWVGNLTTQTSQTTLELLGSIGTFAQGRVIRAYEDAFAETAQSDDAILAITQMQGIRITRYLPAQVTAMLTSTTDVTLAPYTQFQGAGNYFFNQTQITLVAGVPLSVTLCEGQMYAYSMYGLGTERQTWQSSQSAFVISDQDVQVQLNGVTIPKAYGGLWNFDGLPGYSDQTVSTGNLLLQFGNLGGLSTVGQFGTIPMTTDTVVITYPVTQGATGNGLVTNGNNVTVVGFPTITGTFTGNPSGGANNKSVVAYKNVASGGFGTYSSAVTKSQYLATIATYPGIVDVVTQAQREINPMALQWMNTIRISALTTSTWSQAQIQEFLTYAQSVTQYAPYFIWVPPVAVPQTVNVSVYVFNSATPSAVQAQVMTALTNMFAPQPGILQTNFYLSDIENACFNAAPGLISYVIVNEPTGSMIVTAPESPMPTYTLDEDGGTLPPLLYAYAVSSTLMNGQVGTPVNWVFPQVTSMDDNYGVTITWPPVVNAASYQVWGRSAVDIGLLATIPATDPLTYTDMGTTMPGMAPPNGIADVPIQYNSLASLTVNVYYSERQQRLSNQGLISY